MNISITDIVVTILFGGMILVPISFVTIFFYFWYTQQLFNFVIYFTGFVIGGFFCSVITFYATRKNINMVDVQLNDWLIQNKSTKNN